MPHTPIGNRGYPQPGLTLYVPLSSLGFVPGALSVIACPAGASLSIQPATDELPIRVEGFDRPGSYQFYVLGPPINANYRHERSFNISIENAHTGGGSVAVPPAPPQANLRHALPGGAYLMLRFDYAASRVVSPPAPSVSSTSNTALIAAKDAALASAIAGLIGQDRDGITAAMSPVTVGTASYTFTPDVTGSYVFGGVIQVAGTATLQQTFTLKQSNWGGSSPSATLACTNKPTGSTVTSATLDTDSVIYPGLILPLWTSALAAAQTPVEALQGDGWQGV